MELGTILAEMVQSLTNVWTVLVRILLEMKILKQIEEVWSSEGTMILLKLKKVPSLAIVLFGDKDKLVRFKNSKIFTSCQVSLTPENSLYKKH